MNRSLACLLLCVLCFCLPGCDEKAPRGNVGISFGVGPATRWKKERVYMETRAAELGMPVKVIFDTSGSAQKQIEDCLALVDSGASVLILTPSDTGSMQTVLTYARQNNVKVITYARAITNSAVELFVGYDCYKIGQSMGQHLTEKVYHGNIIILKGDANDFNTPLLYYGGMRYIAPLVEKGDLTVIMDEFVPKWSPVTAKALVKKALSANDNRIDGIFASNDVLAGAAAEALKEAGVTNRVIITGMDAERDALRRIASGEQDMTVYLDLKDMAYTAIDQANNMLRNQKVSINSVLDVRDKEKLNAYLINGKVVTRENMDKVLIEPGIYTREEIFGPGNPAPQSAPTTPPAAATRP